MDNNELVKTLNRISADIRELKSRQPIGGDSWVVYRAEINFVCQPEHVYQVDFEPVASGNLVAKAYITNPTRITPGTTRGMIPDNNIPTRWYMVDPSVGTVDRTIFVYSTKAGTLRIIDLTSDTTV